MRFVRHVDATATLAEGDGVDDPVGFEWVGDRDDPAVTLRCLPVGAEVSADAHECSCGTTSEQEVDHHVGGEALADSAWVDFDAGCDLHAADDGVEPDRVDAPAASGPVESERRIVGGLAGRRGPPLRRRR